MKSSFQEIVSSDWKSISQISEIEKETFGKDAISPIQLTLIARSGKIFVLNHGGEIRAESVVIPYFGNSKCLLFSFAVKMGFHGKSLGSRLMENLLEELIRLKVPALELTVNPKNERAFSFYKKFGFEIASLLESYFGLGNHRYLLSKSLKKEL